MVVLQTESPLGISNAKEIYSLPGCDAIFIGPNDLKFQMRDSDGSFPTPEEHEKAIQRIVAAGRDVRLPIGMHVLTAEQANQRIGQGMQFVAVSSDLGMLAGEAHRVSQSLGLMAKADVVRY
jgi:4-hydroxy-2-oxoheptanedioate aldolase